MAIFNCYVSSPEGKFKWFHTFPYRIRLDSWMSWLKNGWAVFKIPCRISKEVATTECDSPLIYQPEMSGHLGMIPLNHSSSEVAVRSQWGRSEVGVRSQWGRCIIYPIDELNTAELFTDYHILP